MNSKTTVFTQGALLAGLLLFPLAASAFDSGSTGEDGEFYPTVDTELELPDDGIFHFTNVTIPENVTVTFEGQAPVTMLATGDVSVQGTIDISGGWSAPVGAAGDGNLGDDGVPGEGGPGGFSGGAGGAPLATRAERTGGPGVGPGGGDPGYEDSSRSRGGAGGSFGTEGRDARSNIQSGPVYGSEVLLPLIGGSGGGGGAGGPAFHGSGGGGGGGAILIAATGTVNITGAVRAVGGRSGDVVGANVGSSGGGGSGGAIRIVADRIIGNGDIVATRGGRGRVDDSARGTSWGRRGGSGRIRLEANTFERTADTSPNFSFGEPSAVFVPGLPGLRIESVAGEEAPERPTGVGDIVLPADTENPVTVVFRTTGVPVGNTVSLTVTPASGATETVVSNALDGTTESATAQVNVSLPEGPSTLVAETTYTIVDEDGDEFAAYTGGEPVKEMRLAATANGQSLVTLVTESGREITMHSQMPAMPGSAG